jgi:type II secretory pathway pseudopilin PulG
MSPTPTSDRTRGQEGFTLAALIVLLTIMSIVIAYTVPMQWSIVMKRERDRQTIFLMKQYARAIMEWQKKHQAPPTSLEQLRDARKPRMIRGEEEWRMPLTGNAEDWILVPMQALVAAVPGAPPAGPPPRNPATNPQPVPQPAAMGATKLNKELSPPEYEGPFVAVRPRATGKSFIALNGAENYDEWVYSVQDLQNEINMRQMALNAK